MRATLTTTYRSLLFNLTRQNTRLEELRNQAATGKRMVKPSDDPSGIRPVLNARGQIRSTERLARTMGTAADQLGNLDTSLGRVENQMHRMKEILVASGNGAMSVTDLQTLGDQVRLVKEETLAVANTQVNGKYLFAGFEEQTRPFDGTPGNYAGDGNAIEYEIGPGEKVKVNLTGPEIFGDPGSGKDIWQLFDDIEAALSAGDSDIALAEMDNLDQAAEQLRNKRSEMGNIAQRVDNAVLNMQDVRINMQETLSRYEDADIVETLTNLTQQETAFQGALQITSKVSELSILNFIR